MMWACCSVEYEGQRAGHAADVLRRRWLLRVSLLQVKLLVFLVKVRLACKHVTQ